MSGVFLFHLRGLDLSRMNATLEMIERSRFRTQGCKQGEEEEYRCCAVPLSLPSGWIVAIHRWAHCGLFTSHASSRLCNVGFRDKDLWFWIGYLSGILICLFVNSSYWIVDFKFFSNKKQLGTTNQLLFLMGCLHLIVDYCERFCTSYLI